MKKSIKNELKEFGVQVGYSILFCEIAATAANLYLGYDFDWAGPALLAAGVTTINRLEIFKRAPQTSFAFGFTQSGQFTSTRRGLFQSVVKWSDGGTPIPRHPNDYTIKTIRYDDIIPQQAYWDVTLRNRVHPIRVFEDDLRKLIYKAAERQRRYHPYPLSRNYFTPRPFSYPEYEALLWILKSCGLVYNREQGKSGKLYLFRPPSALVTHAVSVYASLPN